jgi:hypothetical protein
MTRRIISSDRALPQSGSSARHAQERWVSSRNGMFQTIMNGGGPSQLHRFIGLNCSATCLGFRFCVGLHIEGCAIPTCRLSRVKGRILHLLARPDLAGSLSQEG